MKKTYKLVILLFVLNNIITCIITGQQAVSGSVSNTPDLTPESIKELLEAPWGKLFYGL